MQIILATRNPSKAEQIRAIFLGTDSEILSLDQAGIEGEVVEDGATLEENALKKALYAQEHAKESAWVMSDDTGIFIDALGGEPGVHAAYWGGAELSTEERMQYCLRRLATTENRGAKFRTCVALLSPEGERHFFYGEAHGDILKVPRGLMQPRMAYSSIFQSSENGKTLSEMSV